MIEGRSFTIYTAHKLLTYAFGRSGSLYTPREIRQLGFLPEFTTDIRHIKGVDNVLADFLSCIDALPSQRPPVLDTSLLACLQADDAQLQNYRTSNTILKLEEITFPGDVVVMRDTSADTHSPFVPAALRREISESLRSLSHPGVRASQRSEPLRLPAPKDRCTGLGSHLHILPAIQDAPSSCAASQRHSPTGRAIQLNPHGSRWSFTTI